MLEIVEMYSLPTRLKMKGMLKRMKQQVGKQQAMLMMTMKRVETPQKKRHRRRNAVVAAIIVAITVITAVITVITVVMTVIIVTIVTIVTTIIAAVVENPMLLDVAVGQLVFLLPSSQHLAVPQLYTLFLLPAAVLPL